MSRADIVILVFAGIGAWQGYRQGFLMELISLAAIIFGVFCGFTLMAEGMSLLGKNFDTNESTLPYLSFIIIFLVVVVLVRMLGRWVKNSIDKTFLGSVDQGMGGLLGAFKALFMMSIILWILNSLTVSLPEKWIADSWLYPFTARLAPSMADWLGGFIPILKELFGK